MPHGDDAARLEDLERGIVLVASIAAQFIAAALALRLIKATGWWP